MIPVDYIIVIHNPVINRLRTSMFWFKLLYQLSKIHLHLSLTVLKRANNPISMRNHFHIKKAENKIFCLFIGRKANRKIANYLI